MSPKRAFDVVASSLALLALSPLLAVAALGVAIFLGRPVLFRQRRPGRHGKPFEVLKFRTMRDLRGPGGRLLPDDQRLTSWGRFLRGTSIDELPELINVLRGEMSLVGPRPLLMEYWELYTDEQRRRHDVLPGITGWAQVSGRNSLSWARKFELDLWYVSNRTFWLDVKILLLTAWKVVKRDGISAEGHATMPRFRGRVCVVGAGGHAKVVIGALRASGIDDIEAYDDDAAKWGTRVCGAPVVGPISQLESNGPRRLGVLAIGSNRLRRAFAERLPLDWLTVVDPRANVGPGVELAEGCVVFAGATVQADARIGKHAIVNTGASIDHDCRVGDFAHIAPQVGLAGEVEIGDGAFVGIGAQVLPGIRIGEWATLGAGATAVSDVAAAAVAVGTPAKPRAAEKPESGANMTAPQGPVVPMASAEIDESDVAAVADVVRSGRLALGAKTVEFEKRMAEYIGVRHAVAVSSGTAALHLIVKALGLGPGDEVLVPSFTFAASVNAILFEGARPVFVDIEPDTFNLDPRDLERKLTSRTRAVMPVDVFGHSVDWDPILAFARKHGLRVIDDSCEALGGLYKGRKVGSFGDAAAFAFYPNKQMTTGEGGILVTDDDRIAKLARSYRNQGRDEMGQWLEHVRIGYNFRMDEMSAALGCSQISRLESFLEKRERVARLYQEKLGGFSWVRTPRPRTDVRMSWFVYVVTLEAGLHRDEVIQGLERRGIPARAYFSPIHQQQYLKDLLPQTKAGLEVTEEVARRTLALPFFNQMTEAQVDQVVRALAETVAEARPGRKVA